MCVSVCVQQRRPRSVENFVECCGLIEFLSVVFFFSFCSGCPLKGGSANQTMPWSEPNRSFLIETKDFRLSKLLKKQQKEIKKQWGKDQEKKIRRSEATLETHTYLFQHYRLWPVFTNLMTIWLYSSIKGLKVYFFKSKSFFKKNRLQDVHFVYLWSNNNHHPVLYEFFLLN